MNRIVYLFELDSVKKINSSKTNSIFLSDGVRMLFQKIILNGNTVAISLNQLTDSQFFAQAISDDFAYPILCELFRFGSLRVPLYGKLRTASQYIQQGIEKCLAPNSDSFIFSNLNVAPNETELLQDILDSLKYSDLSKLQERCKNATEEDAVKYEYIYRYVRMILMLSINETSNILPRETSSRDFVTFLNKIIDILSQHTFSNENFDNQIKSALSEIEQRKKSIIDKEYDPHNWLYNEDGTNALSTMASDIITLATRAIQPPNNSAENFVDTLERITTKLSEISSSSRCITNQLKDMLPTASSEECARKHLEDALKEIKQRNHLLKSHANNRSNWLFYKDNTPAMSPLASEIINLSYNYTVEDSINGVSKHYAENDHAHDFAKDLIKRIEKFDLQNAQKEVKTIPKRFWRKALRFSEYKDSFAQNDSQIYEANFLSERRKWKFQVLRRTSISCVWAILYIVLFVITEFSIQQLEQHVDFLFNSALIFSALKIIFVGIAGSIINVVLSLFSKKEIPDILQSISDFFIRLFDCIYIIFRRLK